MNSSYAKVKSKFTSFRNAFLLGLGLLLISQTSLSAQITAAVFNSPSTHKEPVVSVHFKHEPLTKVLQTLARKVNVGISYETEIMPPKRVTYRVSKKSIFKILDDVLKDTGLYSTLSQDRKVIMIKKKPLIPAIRQETITGTVTDAGTGNTLPGVNIRVKGTSTGTSTGSEGQYQLTVESLQDTLVFSFVGYQSQTIPINGRTSIDVELSTSTKALSEMVVVGFGEQSKRKVVGSIESVDSKAIQSSGASSVQKVLSGKVAGVQINAAGGGVGGTTSAKIRGISSINGSSEPLYVVDGLPLINSKFGVSGGGETVGSGGGATNPLLNLDPDNIKSLTVLKDASATAIYGTRGANGVILITTKSGIQGKPRVNINISGGVIHPVKMYHLLNSEQYLNIYNYRHDTNFKPENYANTKWSDLVTRTGSKTKYSASISGGSKESQYFVSGQYNKTKNYMINNGATQFGAKLKLNQQINKKLDFNISLNPSYSNLQQGRDRDNLANTYTMMLLDPPLFPAFKPNGQINDGRDPSVPGNLEFAPFPGSAYANAIGQNLSNKVKQILGNVSVSYDFLPTLTLKTKLGIQSLNTSVSNDNKDYSYLGYPNGSIISRNEEFSNYNWQTTVDYQKDWKNQSLQATLGITFVNTDHKYRGSETKDLPSNNLSVLSAASKKQNIYGNETSYRFQNNLARITYSFKDRYTITATGSYNGTSRFAPGSQYGFFPSVGLGWIISDEDFMNSTNEVVSLLKLRLSYGATGNANIGNFEYLGLLNTGGNYNYQSGLGFSQIENEDLSWESSNQYDISLDYGFLNGKLSGTLSYYYKNDTGLLLSVPVSNINGFTSITKNLGAIVNRGIEFSIKANVLTQQFLWSINANISSNNNYVSSLPGGEFLGSGSYGALNIVKKGEPVGSYYLPVYKGVDHNNGDALYADGNGGTTSSYAKAERKIVGSPTPDFFGGFGTTLSYKGFDANANFQYSYGAKLYWLYGHYAACNGCTVYNQVISQANFWTPQNKDAPNPEPRVDPNGGNHSTRFLSDGTYLRLKTVNVGYTFSFIGNESMRIYVQGLNLLTFTAYKGNDVQASIDSGNIRRGQNFYNLPSQKAWIFGLQLKF